MTNSMKLEFVFISLIFYLSYCLEHNHKLVQDLNKGAKLQSFRVNLDIPYELRWKHVIQAFKKPIQQFWRYIEEDQDADKFELPLYQDSEFLKEIKAISMLANVSFRTSQIISQMYELLDSFACTSIIARNSNGNIIHARNLDYSFADFISPLLAQIEFQSNGIGVYSVDMIVGTVIVATGFRHKSYSLTINQRFDDSDPTEFLKQQYIPPCYLIHQILRTKSTYQEALLELKQSKIAQNAYFIIAGIQGNQGSVIERDKDEIHQMTSLSKQKWFICQTNYDRDQEDPNDDFRRIPCEQKIKKLKRNFSFQDIFDILKQEPNFAYDTLTTDIMIPQLNFFNSTRWFIPKISNEEIQKIPPYNFKTILIFFYQLIFLFLYL